MGTEIQDQLSRALRGIDRDYAALVKDKMTRVVEYEAPFLNDYRIYRVRHLAPHRPIVFYVGFVPRKRAYFLTGEPENMTKMAKADHVVIDSPETAALFASTFLEVTRSQAKLIYQVDSVDDLKFRPNLDDEQQRVKEAIEAQYRTVLSPPAAEPADGDYVVTLYAVRDQALERHSLRVGRRGEIAVDVSVLETGLPLVYGF
jgi:hypothetical protein